MNSDKMFYAAWGLVIIMAGLCAIFGYYYGIEILGIFMIWLLNVGIILVIFGAATINKSKNTATTQIFAGIILTCISAGALGLFLNIIDAVVSVALIIVIIGISILAFGIIKK
jgi:hypothetical protein